MADQPTAEELQQAAPGFSVPQAGQNVGGEPVSAPSPSRAPEEPKGDAAGHVRLGDHEVPVYPQRHAYLTNRIGRFVEGFTESGSDLDTSDFVRFLGDQTYDVLVTFAPSIAKHVSRAEFLGYRDADALERGDYHEEFDRSPTFPEIVAAFTTVFRVNDLDKLGGLKAFVDPTMLRAWIRVQMAKRISGDSSSEPSTSGTPESTSSSTTDPT